LREALKYVLRVEDDALETKTFNRIKESLAILTDTTALDARLKEERERCAKVCDVWAVPSVAKKIRGLT